MVQRYLMSSAQKRIYTLQQVNKESVIYNVPMTFKISKKINYSKLNEAFKKLCQRHEVFRSYFTFEDEKFMQVVISHTDVKVEKLKNKIDEQIEQIVRRFVQPFDLSQAPLIRMGVLETAEQSAILLIDVHHIIFDGASTVVLMRDLCDLYAGKELEPLMIQYKDFAAWQNTLTYREQMTYWISEHANPEAYAEIPTDYPRVKNQTVEGAYVEERIDNVVVERAAALCRETGSTPVMLYMTALMVLLSKYSKEKEVVIGTPAEGRSHPDAQEIIGMFVNTLAIRGQFDANKTFRKTLLYIKEKCLNAYENQDYPFELLLENMNIQRSSNRNPLFDIMFSYEAGNDWQMEFDHKPIIPMTIHTDISKFDLTLTVMEESNGINLNWEYNKNLYRPSTIKRLNQYFLKLLEQCISFPDVSIDDISYLDKEDIECIVTVFNKQQDKIVEQLPIQIFEQQVMKHPSKTAVFYGTDYLSYRELDERANYIGWELKKKGIGSKDVVAIMTGRSIEMICAIIGVLKVGAAYLPIDPNYPDERIEYMIKDSSAALILASGNSYRGIYGKNRTIFLDSQRSLEKKPEQKADPNDIAYIIYTSGTTGKPKGVRIKNESLTNLINWQIKEAGIEEDSIILQKSTYVFDASVWEIFLALLSGSSLQLLSEEENNNFDQLFNIIEQQKVTHTLMIPTVFDALLDYMSENKRHDSFNSLRRIYLGAEAVSKELVSKFSTITGQKKEVLRNLYGPTEGTVCATCYNFSDYDGVGDVPIGSPINNVKIYIMDGNHLCGIGIPGEICIGGRGVSPGYMNNEVLTAEKFQRVELDRPITLYRTGDMGMWRENGDIVYFGRLDDQVKIRGFRVELGEIESRLREQPHVKNAVVILRKEPHKHFCAYVTGEQLLDTEEIKRRLQLELPDYMIPAFIIELDYFPATVNGKLDKGALPVPDINDMVTYEAPIDDVEKLIADILANILQVTKVGRNANFFELGGDSIKAIRVVSRLREAGYEADVRQIMDCAIVKNIAAAVKCKDDWEISQEEVTGVVARTPIQQYFYDISLADPSHFNQSIVLVGRSIISKVLIKAYNAIIRHHDILRMVVKETQQVILSNNELLTPDYEYYDLTQLLSTDITEKIKQRAAIAQKMFNLEKGPLFKILHFETLEESYIVMIIHHLVIDGVSWRIITEDLNTVYDQILKQEEIKLPQKTSSYLGWSDALAQYRESAELSGQISYWSGVNKDVELGRFLHSDEEATKTSQITVKLPTQLTHLLLHKSNHACNTTVRDLLITCLCRTIRTMYGNNELAINLEDHGREKITEQIFIDRTVGWFTALYPVVIKTTSSSVVQDIREVKEQLRKIPECSLGYGVLSTYNPVIARKEADITFNYLGEFSDSNTANKTFKLSDISLNNDISERNIFGSPITLNCAVIFGELEIDMIYHNPILSEEIAQAFLKLFLNELEAIISGCLTEIKPQMTASDYGELSWSDEEFRRVEDRIAKRGERIARIIPMTPMQKGILYHKTLNQESTNYIVQCVYDFKEIFSKQRFIQALEILTTRYDAMRTIIVSEDVNEPRQVVLEASEIECNEIHLNSEADIYESFLKVDVQRGFDLEKDSLLRITILYLPDNSVKLVFCFHHIIIDGWCLSILIGELEVLYSNSSIDTEYQKQQEKLEHVYEKFSRYIDKKDKREALDYWEQLLDEYDGQSTIESLDIPEKLDEEIATVNCNLTEAESYHLADFCRKMGLTISTVIETAWGIVLQHYNNTDDVVFGKIVSGRNQDIPGIEQEIGLFINAIPVRVKLLEEDTARTLLKRMQMQAIDSSEYDYVPLFDIQSKCAPKRELIHSIFAFENYHTSRNEESGLFTSQEYREQTSYQLSISAAYADRLYLKLMYTTKDFSQKDSELIMSRMIKAIRAILQYPDMQLGDLKLLDADEQQILIERFNNSAFAYNRQDTVLNLLKMQSVQNPEGIAVSFSGSHLTYGDLNRASNHLAAQLLECSNKAVSKTVGLVCRRSLEMVIGIYGILKAGMTYLPISPELPVDRIQFMLSDSGAQVIAHPIELSDFAQNLHVVDSCVLITRDPFEQTAEEINMPGPGTDAYMIYTSGTTGKPKGVTVTHAALMNLTYWLREYLRVDKNSKVLQQFNFIFDGCVLEIFPAGIAGAELVIVPDEVKTDAERFLKYLPGKMLLIVPSTFKMLLECAKEQKMERYIKSLACVCTGGEILTNAVVKQYFEMAGSNSNLYNLYGPTETTVCSSAYKVNGKEYGSIPIGKPVGNTNLYIMQGNKLCGIGIVGELCIGGAGVTAGYKNQEQLTAEKFIDSSGDINERVYRTGDLAKWDFDGNLRYIGRSDEQVKIRGFRIELGEIQSQICGVEGVKDAVVIVDKINNESNLCAYLVADSGLDIARVKEQLRQQLPEYMLPTHFAIIDQLPLTKSGKVDKRALPAPTIEARQYKEPETPSEKKVAKAFEEVLNIDDISNDDSFLHLGGHSLTATKLVNKLAIEYGVKIPLSIIIKEQTIERIALYIDQMQEMEFSSGAGIETIMDMEIAEEEVF